MNTYTIYNSDLAKAWYHGAAPRYATWAGSPVVLAYIVLPRITDTKTLYLAGTVWGSRDETRPIVVCVNWNVSLTTWHCFETTGIAGRKRPRSSSDGFTTRGKHKIGYRASWKTDFPWHTPVYDSSESTVIGLLCSVCKRHGTKPRNHSAIWTTRVCTQLTIIVFCMDACAYAQDVHAVCI